MSIVIDTPTVHKSIATVLHSIDATATIYDNPNQQGTKLPAWFIVHREPVSITEEINQRHWLVYHIDIYYMLEYNRPRLFDEYAAIADQLDLNIEYLPIYEGDGALVHVFERSWELAMNALKYSITLRFRVRRDVVPAPYMQVIEDLEVFLKEAFPMKHVFFENTTYPDANIRMPNRLITHLGGMVELPAVEGLYQDSEGKYWQPSSWDIGEFGAEYGPLHNDVTANLLFKLAVFEAYCSSDADINYAVLANDATIQLYDKHGQTIPYNSANTYTLTHAWGKLLDNDEIVEWTQGLINHLYIVDRNSYTFARCMAVSYSGYDIYLSKVEYTMEAIHEEEGSDEGRSR